MAVEVVPVFTTRLLTLVSVEQLQMLEDIGSSQEVTCISSSNSSQKVSNNCSAGKALTEARV